MKLNNTLPPMGSLAHNKSPQAKPNLNTQRDGSVALVITTARNALNFSGLLRCLTQDSIKLSSTTVEAANGLFENRLLADAYRPGSRSFRENTPKELGKMNNFLKLYHHFHIQNRELSGAEPVIQSAHLEVKHPYEQIEHSGIIHDFQSLRLPENNLPLPNRYQYTFKPADADGGEQLLEIPFILTTNLASTSKTIRGLAEIIGQMGEQLFDQKATHGV
jgi:hypothetical protein